MLSLLEQHEDHQVPGRHSEITAELWFAGTLRTIARFW